jgi:hypothetical protein
MATLATQTVNRAGVNQTLSAANGGGDAMAVGSGMFLRAKNASGGNITVTIAIPAGASGYPNVAYTSTAVVVPLTTGDMLIGPISSLYADPTTGLATITYSGVTSLTVGAFNLAQP